MKKQPRPNFDALSGKPMMLAFIFSDGDVKPLIGKCRGFGAISGREKAYETTIGIYTAKGDYHNVMIDLRVKCAIPTFMIGDTQFYYHRLQGRSKDGHHEQGVTRYAP